MPKLSGGDSFSHICSFYFHVILLQLLKKMICCVNLGENDCLLFLFCFGAFKSSTEFIQFNSTSISALEAPTW